MQEQHELKMFVGPKKPLTVKSCQGNYLHTEEHGTLVDFESGCWAAVLGHCRSEIAEIMGFQASALFHTHQFFNSPYPGELTRALSAGAGLTSIYAGSYLSSGSEAVSLAVSLAELLTGKKRKMSFAMSYLSCSPELRMPRNPEYWMDLDIEACIGCDKQCESCSKFKDLDLSQIAAFVFEPGNAGGLVHLPPKGLIRFLSERVRAAGGLVIANEVTTGFGRTGRWFGFQHYEALAGGNEPDLIAMGKGLGNGYPISGVLLKSNLKPQVTAQNFRYVQSHIDDPLGCAVALEVVHLMVENNMIHASEEKGHYLHEKLKGLTLSHEGLKEVRGRGLMQVAVLDPQFKAYEVFEALLTAGYFAGFNEAANLIRFYPPMTIEVAQIDGLIDELEKYFKSH